MEFAFTQEHLMIRDSAERFLAQASDSHAVRASMNRAHGMRIAGLTKKTLGAVANHQVFFGKSELHGGCLCKADGCAKSGLVAAVNESLKRTRAIVLLAEPVPTKSPAKRCGA